MGERYNFINYRDRFNLPPKAEPKIDEEVSKIVGKKVHVNDPRLIKLVIKWKANKNPDNVDNYLHDENKRNELRQVFNS